MTTSKPTLEPAIFVVFGITGDLAAKKLLPALYHLVKDNLFHEKTIIVGVTRRVLTAAELLSHVEVCVNEVDQVCDPVALEQLRQKLEIHTMDLTAAADYVKLKSHLDSIEAAQGECMNRLFYLSVPPQAMEQVVEHLGRSGLNGGCEHKAASARLLIEKPFGWDLASAKALVRLLSEHFHEDQLFRIDHYLAREMVQNILTFRAENPLFQAVWDSDHIESIRIVAKERIGIEGRAVFYEQTGALRDFVQSHLLQMLAIVAMEIPATLSSEEIHSKKLQLLNQVNVARRHNQSVQAWRGQYETYREEAKNPASVTETYAKVRLTIASQRWTGTPITLETGKALDKKVTEITLRFRTHKQPGKLIFKLYPEEGIELDLLVKKPGFEDAVQPAKMVFTYRDAFSLPEHPNAYERVLVDAARGDHTLFTTSEETLACWRIIQPVLEYWQQPDAALFFYPDGANPKDFPAHA